MSDQLKSRTARLAQFLKLAAEIKTKKVTEVAKYPNVLWFYMLPPKADKVRSPLLAETWDPNDFRWLVVSRTTEPDHPRVPELCKSWTSGEEPDSPEEPPTIMAMRTIINANGQEEQVEPTPEVKSRWVSYIENDWTPWSERAKIARQVKVVYQQLFDIHQEMLGREDAYDLFVGIGLLSSKIPPDQPLRRHFLAFPAELMFDSRSGTLTVVPSSDFDKPRLEMEFLQAGQRAAVQPHVTELEAKLAEIGPAIHARPAIGDIVKALTHSLGVEYQYADTMEPQNAAVNQGHSSFAPALILRPRGNRSLDGLLDHIEQTNVDINNPLTIPWRRLVEDQSVWEGSPENPASGVHGGGDERVYFPLPSNEEQSRIVKYSTGAAGVVVQGPPGTGKSHTIANLIAHYLATGQRVLVTAQTAQALQVLRDKLPKDLQALCVSLLGAGMASNKDLERSVRGILAKRQEVDDLSEYDRRGDRIENQLEKCTQEVVVHERLLLDARVSETVEVHAVPGYKGTRAAIARRLEAEGPTLGWIEDALDHEMPCPSWGAGWEDLAAYHGTLSVEVKKAIATMWFSLPSSVEEYAAIASAIAEAKAALLDKKLGSQALPISDAVAYEDLQVALEWLRQMQQLESTTSEGDKAWVNDLRSSIIKGQLVTWTVLGKEAAEALNKLSEDAVRAIRPVSVTDGKTRGQALQDLQRLIDHYRAGGKRRLLGIVKPAVVKETEWVEQHVQLGGAPVRSVEELKRAYAALKALKLLEDAWEVWKRWPLDKPDSPRQQYACLQERCTKLNVAAHLGGNHGNLPLSVRAWIRESFEAGAASSDCVYECRRHQSVLALMLARKRRDAAVAAIDVLAGASEVAPSIALLREALLLEDSGLVRVALSTYVKEGQDRGLHARYIKFVGELRSVAPQTAARMVQDEGTPSWIDRFPLFDKAWAHRCAAVWLERVLSKEHVQSAERAARDGRTRIQELTKDLATTRAWGKALVRIHDTMRATLEAWSRAVRNIPRTGPSVFRKRAVARSYLSKCLSAIPAWVVSLGRLYETIEPSPGMFDIAIVDEASQCWLDSLVLFYLAKRVIVVGDDKQISPTIVGVQGGELERLANALLKDFAHRGMFTVESSLFDHAKVYLPVSIQLREHFRCVPEIIRFSDMLCYQDNPLIPLRQCGKDRLEPLKPVYVASGTRQGDINEVEAHAVVEHIVRCHQDPKYEDCEFGVICLQGDMQATRIQQMLLENLGPGIFTERNLRCGDAYAFQGDERDVMFLSMVAAPNVDNAPLTKTLFEQRFNVALSRARDQVWLFHSIRDHELNPLCLRRKTLDFFYQPPDNSIRGVELDIPSLRFRAERDRRQIGNQPQPFDSWFELDVALALAAKGYTLSAQVLVARKRIDLVVEGNEGVRLAVECDGEHWHGPEEFEKDLFRQRQLERAQWRFVRVRESVFYANPASSIGEVVYACEELGIEPAAKRQAQADAEQPSGGSGRADSSTIEDMPSSNASESSSGATEEPERAAPETAAVSGRSEETAEGDHQEEGEEEGGGETETDSEGAYPDPRNAPRTNVQDAILDIVEKSGPLPKSLLFSQYRKGCPRIQRVGKQLKHNLNREITDLQRMGKLVSIDEGTRRDLSEVVVRLPTQTALIVRPRGDRQIEDIPLSELAFVFRQLSGGQRSELFDGDQVLQRRVLENYGLRALTQRAGARLSQAEALAFDGNFWKKIGMDVSLFPSG